MTRGEFTKRNAEYSKAVVKWGRPCVLTFLVAVVILLRNPLPSLQTGTIFAIAIASPPILLLVALHRLRSKLGLDCVQCGQGLNKPKRAAIVLNTGKCPFCQSQIIEDKGEA